MMKLSRCFAVLFLLCFVCQSLSLCCCLNDEGLFLLRSKQKIVSDSFSGDDHVDSKVKIPDGKVGVLSVVQAKEAVHRRLLQTEAATSTSSDAQNEETRPPPPTNSGPFFNPYSRIPPASSPSPPRSSLHRPSLAPSPLSRQKRRSPPVVSVPPPEPSPPMPSPPGIPIGSAKKSSSKRHLAAILAGAFGGVAFLSIVAVSIYFCRSGKVATVRPWATGLSGQLQKAFVTGVPKLKRSELQSACEDFSNVIGSLPIGSMYKGTLSNGVEIAVTSVSAESSKQWSKNLEMQFRKKVETLSKVNHKNFVNLLGYCVEENPFTRMMVFEYAPNGTLFEHLHFKEAEHLDWGMRLRIAMGVAYCLDHMHQLDPLVAHANLNSSAVYLTEDYAAKISEFTFWNDLAAAGTKSSSIIFGSTESNVYSFGVILVEMVTGKLPYAVDDASLEDWASDYLKGEEPLAEIVDETLDSYDKEQVEKIGEVIKCCVHPNPGQRPTMKEVAGRLREITSITPEMATPKLSPLWWAELEVASGDGS